MLCNIYWKMESSQNENIILIDGVNKICLNESNIED
jgi:hypothetical protein